MRRFIRRLRHRLRQLNQFAQVVFVQSNRMTDGLARGQPTRLQNRAAASRRRQSAYTPNNVTMGSGASPVEDSICSVTNIAMEHRRNEPARTWFRSHRIFRSDSSWYFHTREGIDVGPFASEFEAQIEASILKSLLKEIPAGNASVAAVRQFQLDAGTSSCNLRAFTDYVEKEGRF